MKNLLLCLLSAVAMGCSTIGSGISLAAPEVRIADLEFLGGGLFEQRYRVTLRVVNPNDVALPIDGLRFALGINERPFARGATSSGVTVPRLGDATLTLDATTSTFDLVRQVLDVGENETVRYDLSGAVFVPTRWGRELPFVQRGELELLPQGAVRKFIPARSTRD